MLLVVPVLLLAQHHVAGLQPRDLIIDAEEIGLEASEVVEFLFEGGDDDVLVGLLALLEGG